MRNRGGGGGLRHGRSTGYVGLVPVGGTLRRVESFGRY